MPVKRIFVITAVFTIQDDDLGYTLFLPHIIKP